MTWRGPQAQFRSWGGDGGGVQCSAPSLSTSYGTFKICSLAQEQKYTFYQTPWNSAGQVETTDLINVINTSEIPCAPECEDLGGRASE